MVEIKLIDSGERKSMITDRILRQLPNWFGIEKAIQEYVENVKNMPFFAVYDNEKEIGFICLKHNNQYTAEIYVMGILEQYHRRGIGKRLLDKAEEYLRENKYKHFMVKTLGESRECEYYRRTREFYRSAGFYPLEEIKEVWGEENPCLIMVKSL